MFQKVFNILSGFQGYITLALFVGLLSTSAGWYVTNTKLKTERILRQNDRLVYQEATAQAVAKSYLEVIKKEREYEAAKAEADASYIALRDKYNSALLRYTKAQSTANKIYLSGSSETTDGSVTTRESTRLSITLSDASICADNTARLQAVRQWALSLGLTDTKPE